MNILNGCLIGSGVTLAVSGAYLLIHNHDQMEPLKKRKALYCMTTGIALCVLGIVVNKFLERPLSKPADLSFNRTAKVFNNFMKCMQGTESIMTETIATVNKTSVFSKKNYLKFDHYQKVQLEDLSQNPMWGIVSSEDDKTDNLLPELSSQLFIFLGLTCEKIKRVQPILIGGVGDCSSRISNMRISFPYPVEMQSCIINTPGMSDSFFNQKFKELLNQGSVFLFNHTISLYRVIPKFTN